MVLFYARTEETLAIVYIEYNKYSGNISIGLPPDLRIDVLPFGGFYDENEQKKVLKILLRLYHINILFLKEGNKKMMRQYKYMGINWKVNAEKDILGKMDCLLGDYYKESYAPKVDFEVTLVEKISSDLTEILEYGVPITIHNSKKPSVHEEGLVYLNGYIRMIYNKATKSVYRLNYLSKKINIFNKDKSSLVKDGIRVIRDIVKALAEDSGGVMVHAAAFKKNDKGVLLIGGKGSGKTTLSLKFLYEHGCSEVSRDRVILKPEKQSFYIYGWPNYYNLTLRTMRDFSKTRSMLRRNMKS